MTCEQKVFDCDRVTLYIFAIDNWDSGNRLIGCAPPPYISRMDDIGIYVTGGMDPSGETD